MNGGRRVAVVSSLRLKFVALLLAAIVVTVGPAFGQASDYGTLVKHLDRTGRVDVGYRNQQGEIVRFEWVKGRRGSVLLKTQMFLMGRDDPMPIELEDFDRDGRPDVWRLLDPAASPTEIRAPNPELQGGLFMWNIGVSAAARLIRRQTGR